MEFDVTFFLSRIVKKVKDKDKDKITTNENKEVYLLSAKIANRDTQISW